MAYVNNELVDFQEKIAAANGLEHDDASNLEDHVKEVQEFEYICKNIALEEEGNNADANNKGGDVYNSIMVSNKTQ